MKATNLIKAATILIFAMVLSTSVFAQDKPAKAEPCCPTETKHVCTDECKTDGCAAVDAKAAMVKHECTDECHTIGCAAVDAKAAKTTAVKAMSHVCTDECKTIGCDAVKAKDAKVMMHKCEDECKTNGCTMAKM